MAAVAVEVPDAKKLPPGFRFHPSDEEIVAYYLRNKVSGRKPDIEVIREIDLYKSEPWDLPEKSILPTRDLEWYFFCPRDKKYPNGSRSNRATEKGYWKATGKDRKVKSQSNKIGMKKTLVFYEGRAPHGQRTDWLMHEYRLDEAQCNGTPHLQELYVVCRVFKKGKLVSKNEELYGTSNEFDFHPSKSNLSPTNINTLGEIEEQSEERPSPLTQDDEMQTTGLRSETSSEIIDNKTDDNPCFDDPTEFLQGRSNPDYSNLSYNVTFANKNVDIEPGTEELLFESTWQMNSPHWDVFFDGNDFPLGDVLEGGYGNDLYDYLRSIEEPNNYEPYFGEVNNGMPVNGVDLQFRARSSPWQSPQQPLPNQGTAIRRIRLQMHKTDESSDWSKPHGLIGDCQLECHDCNTDDSETVTQTAVSALASLPRKTSSLEEDDADSGFVYDPSEASERVTNDHSLIAASAQALVYGLSTGGSSERSEDSLKATGSEEKSILSGTLDSLKSSDYGQSSSLCFGPLIETIQDNSERPQEQFNKFVGNVGNGVSISVIKGQTLIENSELVEKCEDIVSESNSEVPNQVPEFSDSLLKGEKLVSHGTSSTGFRPETQISLTSAKEMKLVNEGMKYSSTMSFKKGNLASDTVAMSTSLQARAISSHGTGIEDTGISCKGSVKHLGFNLILRGLKLRRKPRTNDIMFGGEERSMDVTKSFSFHCSREGAHGSVNLQKIYGIFKWFSKLQSKFSKGSNSISLLLGLLGTVFLVFFVQVIWPLARSSPPIIF